VLDADAITGNLNRVTNAIFDQLFEGGLSQDEKQDALLSFWASVTFLAGVGACAWLANHITSWQPESMLSPALWAASFLPVAIVSSLWLRAHDVAFAQDVQEKQLTRLAADLAAAATFARAGKHQPKHLGRGLTGKDRSASLPMELQQSLLMSKSVSKQYTT